MKTEKTDKKKKADEKICADCKAREYFTSICQTLGFNVRRTDFACHKCGSEMVITTGIIALMAGMPADWHCPKCERYHKEKVKPCPKCGSEMDDDYREIEDDTTPWAPTFYDEHWLVCECGHEEKVKQ
jgi:hypothetical protein